MIYIFPKDGSGKGTRLNINHDNVPQVIDKTLAGVSHDKEISKGNVTHTQPTLKEERKKDKRNKEQKN